MAMFEKHKSGKQDSLSPQESKVTPPAPSMGATTASAASKVAMIGQGISVSGDVTANSNLKVEGLIEGRSVQSSQDVEVSEMGKVTANVMAKVVKIAGEVSGDIAGSEKVMISRTGRVQGNIVSPRVQLEDGAVFRGSIDMNPATPAAEKKDAPAAPAASGKSKAAPAGSPRKEPNLTLKSG